MPELGIFFAEPEEDPFLAASDSAAGRCAKVEEGLVADHSRERSMSLKSFLRAKGLHLLRRAVVE
jgi:hypothetical protein